MQNYILISCFGIMLLVSCTKESGKTYISPSFQDPPCATELIKSDVRWTSMLPIYQDGDMIEYASGYYQCHDVQRDDIVIFDSAGKLIIKRVVGIPWDEWKYEDGKIIMNGIPLKNSEWREYQIQSRMLSIYAKSYPTIPKDTYMIFGNRIDGTLDSSKFWLIAKQDIVGKVDTTKKKR